MDEDIITCEKCGVLLNKDVVLKSDGTSYHPTYKGVCPVCKNELMVCE